MDRMTAMEAPAPRQALRAVEREVPQPGEGQLLLRVAACGVCRTDLHVIDGEIGASYPVIPGHEIVGRVLKAGSGVTGFQPGDRVGVPWLGRTCGTCRFCLSGQENLCDAPVFTGATRDGGYATHVVADARFCFPLPDGLSDVEAAPLLCAGLIGWRAWRLAGTPAVLGLFGFGAAAHILAKIIGPDHRLFAFTRPGDEESQSFARQLGCEWAGNSDDRPPVELDAAIIFAPAGELVPLALKRVRKGGKVVCAGIHMSDIPAFPYADLWGERQILSVANLTREDGTSFLAAAARSGVRPVVETFPLARANEAIDRLRAGTIQGAAVLVPETR